MIPAPFEYVRAGSPDEAVRLLADLGTGAKLLAGGHSLIPLLRLRLAAPTVLVDIGRLDDLRYIRADDGHVAIGGLTRHADLLRSPVIRTRAGLLADVAATVGDRQVRHRGTIGGSVAHGDPAADLPAALVALDAEFEVMGPNGNRVIEAAEMFRGYFETGLGNDELLIEIRIPAIPSTAGWAYEKFTQRAQDWAVVGAAVLLELDGSIVKRARVGLANMASRPLRAVETERALVGATLDAFHTAAEMADSGAEPPEDLAADEAFRRHLARVVTRRALQAAFSRTS